MFGRVEDIQIFTTLHITPDNKTVIIPNAQAIAGNVVNYSKKGDYAFGFGLWYQLW